MTKKSKKKGKKSDIDKLENKLAIVMNQYSILFNKRGRKRNAGAYNKSKNRDQG